MKFVTYDPITGKIVSLYESSCLIENPNTELSMMQVSDHYRHNLPDTHVVQGTDIIPIKNSEEII